MLLLKYGFAIRRLDTAQKMLAKWPTPKTWTILSIIIFPTRRAFGTEAFWGSNDVTPGQRHRYNGSESDEGRSNPCLTYQNFIV